MPKSSVKSNNHHHHHNHNNSHHQQQNHNSNHNSNHINSPDNSQQCTNNNTNTPYLQNKDAAKRLKRKLRLQEMRCNLMSTKMTELKTALSTKKRQLRVSEKRAKDEEKKRRDEEKKLKDMEKEFHRLRKEHDQIKENLARNQNIKSTSSIATATTPTLSQQQQRQPQASTSNSNLNNNNSSSPQSFTHTTTLTGTPSVPNSSNKNKHNKQNKRMTALIADDSPQVRAQASKSLVNQVPVPMIIGANNSGNSKKSDTTPSKPSSKDLRINEGASCSGVNGITTNCTDTPKISNNVINNNDVNHFFGTSKLEDLFENELMCPICHELYIKPVALSCSHIFCSFCIEQWRRKAHRCPICRNMILDRSPQNVLENVIDKVVSTMDEDSKKRRSDVIKDRPVSSEFNRFSRNEGHRRDRLLMSLQNDWRDLAEYVDRSDSYSDSDSYIQSYSSAIPAYANFQSDSDLDLDSDYDQEQMFGPLFDRNPYGYNDDDDDYDDQEDSATEGEDDEDDTEDVEYTTDDDILYDGELNDDEIGEDYNFDHDSSGSSWEIDHSWQSSGQNSPITIDSESDNVSESFDYSRRNYDNDDSIYSEGDEDHDDQEEDEDEEDEDEEDEEDEEERDDNETQSEEEDDEDEDEDDEENEENDDEVLVPGTDSELDASGNSSSWESMDMTESDSDL